MVKVSRAKAAALREEIFDSTATELRRVGYDATALTTVAAGCGLATSAIYNRFPGKEQLVAALVDERLEPVLGRALDADLASIWQEPSLIGLIDGDQLCVLYELQLAARRVPEIRGDVVGFVDRRLKAALAARRDAELQGRVRANQDPRAQVLLQAAADTGSYLLSLASHAPSGGMASVDQIVRIAVTKVPWDTPASSGRTARRRRDPGSPASGAQGLDELGEDLVRSGADVFAEQGYDAATVAEISRRAGVTTGAIYNRFSGKAGLLAEVVAQVTGPNAIEPLARLSGALTAGSAPAAGRVIASLLGESQDPELARDTALRLEARHASRLEPEVADVVGPVQDHVLAVLAEAVRVAQGTGQLRTDVDAEALAWWFVSLHLGVAVMEDAFTSPIDWAPTLGAFIRALRTPPA
ncbi:MAG TPA: TetR/AcrR family transcriptional regulator [Acidimicrobiales bacterium]